MAEKQPDIKKIFQSFDKLNVLIIGDVMIDSYMWGQVNRISPEAPVPIVSVNKKDDRLGGAANVALNIQAMGATPFLCSVTGNDKASGLFTDLLKKQKISSEAIIKSKDRTTTVKTRIIGNNHQMLRVDEEVISPLNKKETTEILLVIKEIIAKKKIDVIIFEDYDKGCITPELIKAVVELASKKKIPTVVDPKKNNFRAYKGVSLFKPNLKELKEGIKEEFDHTDLKSLSKAVGKFMKEQDTASAMITLSEKGIYIHDNKTQSLIPAHVRNISDVSGAGDTVVSIAALCVALKLPSIVTATLSNLAGGLVCEQIGVVPVNKKQLQSEALLLNF
ncbi:MAG: bifunctional ADP-heptose synthase [Bacteroidota bacterium]|nr:bifunctional ADP-heptose synthase [Bacteroidota bacterium]